MSFYHWRGDKLILALYVQTQAGATSIVGLQADRLKIKLKSAPVAGKANQELIAFMAKQFAVPKTQVSIISGEHSRHKTLQINSPVLESKHEIYHYFH
jgi:uncharacterized protein